MLSGANVFEIRDIQEDERRGANEAIRMKQGYIGSKNAEWHFRRAQLGSYPTGTGRVVGMLTCNVYFWSASTAGGNCRRSNSLATDYGGRGGDSARAS
jgi:hypothetical protein